jgi:hypothetical protein
MSTLTRGLPGIGITPMRWTELLAADLPCVFTGVAPVPAITKDAATGKDSRRIVRVHLFHESLAMLLLVFMTASLHGRL